MWTFPICLKLQLTSKHSRDHLNPKTTEQLAKTEVLIKELSSWEKAAESSFAPESGQENNFTEQT